MGIKVAVTVGVSTVRTEEAPVATRGFVRRDADDILSVEGGKPGRGLFERSVPRLQLFVAEGQRKRLPDSELAWVAQVVEFGENRPGGTFSVEASCDDSPPSSGR